MRNLGFLSQRDYQTFEIAHLKAKLGEQSSSSIRFEYVNRLEHIDEISSALAEVFTVHGLDKSVLDHHKGRCSAHTHELFRKFSDLELEQILRDEVWLKERNSQLVDLSALPKSNIFTLRDHLLQLREYLAGKAKVIEEAGKGETNRVLNVEFEKSELFQKGICYLKAEIDFSVILE